MLRNYNLKIRPVEMLLGLGLGLGYMTSLRFFGPIGIAELMVLIAILDFIQELKASTFKNHASKSKEFILGHFIQS